MTYKLEPGLVRITSLITLILPNGEKRRYESGEELTGAVFDRKWRVVEIRAVENTVEIRVEPVMVPEINAVGEETFF